MEKYITGGLAGVYLGYKYSKYRNNQIILTRLYQKGKLTNEHNYIIYDNKLLYAFFPLPTIVGILLS